MAGVWLLDLCPRDFRGYSVLRQYPLDLAWLDYQNVQLSGRPWPAG